MSFIKNVWTAFTRPAEPSFWEKKVSDPDLVVEVSSGMKYVQSK